MTAVYNFQYSIDPSLDISTLSAEDVWGLLVANWGPTIESQRVEKKNLLIGEGLSAPNTYTLLTKASRTLSSSRQFIDPNDSQVQAYKTWHETAIPSTLGPFTLTVSVMLDDQNLDGKPYFETV